MDPHDLLCFPLHVSVILVDRRETTITEFEGHFIFDFLEYFI